MGNDRATAAGGRGFARHRLPPQAKGWPLVGPLPSLASDLFGFLTDARAEHGDVYRLNLGGQKFVVLNHPRHAEHVMLSRSANYIKEGPMWRVFRQLVGKGIATSEGQLWRRQRRMIQPQFHLKKVAALTDQIVSAIDESLDGWDEAVSSKRPIDAERALLRMTMKVILRTMFGTGINEAESDRVAEAFTFALDFILRGMVFSLLPKWLPAPGQRRYRESIQIIHGTIDKVIADRQRHRVDSDDFIQMLLDAVDTEDGKGMSNEQLRDEAVTLFLGGYETSAVVLSWTLHLLERHPEVAARLCEEVDTVLGERTPTFDDLRSLSYSRQVLQETMRLIPPIWWLTRAAVDDDTIDGFHIPAGTSVILLPYTIHHHPEHWPESTVFDPDRFSAERSADRHRQAFMPFGTGQRMCIGREFALMEGQLILARILQRYRLPKTTVAAPSFSTRDLRVSSAIKRKGGIFIELAHRARDSP